MTVLQHPLIYSTSNPPCSIVRNKMSSCQKEILSDFYWLLFYKSALMLARLSRFMLALTQTATQHTLDKFLTGRKRKTGSDIKDVEIMKKSSEGAFCLLGEIFIYFKMTGYRKTIQMQGLCPSNRWHSGGKIRILGGQSTWISLADLLKPSHF